MGVVSLITPEQQLSRVSEQTLKAKLDALDGVEYDRIAGLNGHRYSIEWHVMKAGENVREAVEAAGYEWNPVGRFDGYAHPPE